MPKPPEPTTNVVRLAPVAKRLGALTTAQHEEIARLIKSSMDSTSKNPTPALTPQGRIVVESEITVLANFAFVRRTKNHSRTFTRALAAWERRLAETPNDPNDECRQRIESEGRLAIEHLWRWLHGYVKPIVEDQAATPIEVVDDNEGRKNKTLITFPTPSERADRLNSVWKTDETRKYFNLWDECSQRDRAAQPTNLVDLEDWKRFTRNINAQKETA